MASPGRDQRAAGLKGKPNEAHPAYWAWFVWLGRLVRPILAILLPSRQLSTRKNVAKSRRHDTKGWAADFFNLRNECRR
jgi:hypothetical protein